VEVLLWWDLGDHRADLFETEKVREPLRAAPLLGAGDRVLAVPAVPIGGRAEPPRKEPADVVHRLGREPLFRLLVEEGLDATLR